MTGGCGYLHIIQNMHITGRYVSLLTNPYSVLSSFNIRDMESGCLSKTHTPLSFHICHIAQIWPSILYTIQRILGHLILLMEPSNQRYTMYVIMLNTGTPLHRGVETGCLVPLSFYLIQSYTAMFVATRVDTCMAANTLI